MRNISKYQLFAELPHGPITRIYKAIQSELDRVVLVKQLNPELINDKEVVARFKQEGLILAKINSPYVITIFDFGYENDIPFLVTEFVEGSTLKQIIEKHGPLPYDLSLFILQQLARGLAIIHRQNIVHQDIKPENIFVSNQGEVKLGDLGFSTSLEQANQQILGTPAYLPPEVILSGQVDFRSDLYSLGLVGYQTLTGENPFSGDDLQTVLNRIVNIKPLPVSAINPDIPEQLSDIIAKLMARDVESRFNSVKELGHELEDLRISQGIQVDSNSLISFLQAPDKYQITRILTSERMEAPVAMPKSKKRAVLALGIATIGLVIILLSRFVYDRLNFLPGAGDTTTTAMEIKAKQPEYYPNVPIDSIESEKENKPESTASQAMSENVIKNVAGDSIGMLLSTGRKKDSLLISSDPRSAVFQAGDSLGITPVFSLMPSQGTPMVLEFRTPGFPIIKKTVTISDEPAQNIHINLWQEVGYLDLSIVPWGEIWIDGDSVDVSPINRPIILAPGNHKLMVRHPSLKIVTEQIYVATGETLRKEIQLLRR